MLCLTRFTRFLFFYFGFALFVCFLAPGLLYNFLNDIFFDQKCLIMINPVYRFFSSIVSALSALRSLSTSSQ